MIKKDEKKTMKKHFSVSYIDTVYPFESQDVIEKILSKSTNRLNSPYFDRYR